MTHRELPPEGYYSTFKEWLNTTSLRKRKHRKRKHFNDPVDLSEPLGLESPTFWTLRFSEARDPYRQRNGIIDIMPKGRICGAKPDVLSPDHKLIWEHSREMHKDPQKHSIFELQKLPPLTYTDDIVALLSSKDSHIYYHWMFDVLPRIYLMHKRGILADKYVINGKRLAPFQYETLQALGIRRSQIIESHDELHLQARKLIMPHFTSGIRPQWVCEFLRKKLMIQPKLAPIPGYKRIYISRANARKRKLLNEPEVIRLLQKYGFRSVSLETMPVSQQIQIFSGAEAVVAPHGAGLTNIVFSPPGIKVIEMLSPQLVHNCYPILSSHMKHQHYYLIGEGERPPEYIDPHDHKADIRVNLNELHRLLKMARL
ncbi:glycosyltransferase family 61 protein [Paenibacillus hexagrammi]|uniref:Glycosyltransferase family 61 protein n=1 Tax=Paenibacillus hexagrammi TaxID=2908839 RepID=A0ABY3SFA2_9BACL|nr:glycosyltransferase family 61 protein [Paenibacillus sp. YPD9-1]UJF32105.1 glycosyltransferase family 61 protein [Paenibacillus sp. YPD9-1]